MEIKQALDGTWMYRICEGETWRGGYSSYIIAAEAMLMEVNQRGGTSDQANNV